MGDRIRRSRRRPFFNFGENEVSRRNVEMKGEMSNYEGE